MSETLPEPAAGAALHGRPSRGVQLTGITVAPGLVLGPVHRKDHELTGALTERVPRGGVEHELARFQRARERARAQLRDLKVRIEGRVDSRDARILDTHLTYLEDSAFLSDVENLITGEQMRLEAAIAKVVADFDRIFRLVESEVLRQSAVDLRDVGIRVLRNLDGEPEGEGAAREEPEEYVLVARELNIVDMFNLANEHVLGVVTEDGGLTSHAAIFARSMRIPTLTGVAGLLEEVREGDFVILDAAEGTLRVNPDEFVVRQYRRTRPAPAPAPESGVPERVVTADGVEVSVGAICGNLPEVEEAAELGFRSVGLYRTELLFLVESGPPSFEALTQHYASVLAAAPDGAVTFRLFDVDPGLAVPWLGGAGATTLGRSGIRVLLEHPSILRRQLRALLAAAEGAPELRAAVPFVTDSGELARVRELFVEARHSLRKDGRAAEADVRVGAVVETAAALVGMRDLVRDADFLVVNLDALVQNLLSVDRDHPGPGGRSFRELHPYVLRALGKLVAVASEAERELSIFGVSAADNPDLGVGLGLRAFDVPPSDVAAFLERVAAVDASAAGPRARRLAAHASPADRGPRVESYHHGQAGS